MAGNSVVETAGTPPPTQPVSDCQSAYKGG